MMRIVVKIGTSSVTDEHGAMNEQAIATLCDQVAQLREQHHEVLVVTSGAVAGGVAALGLSQRPTDTQTLQALAAVGQSQLMNRYNHYLAERSLIGAQVFSYQTTSLTAHNICTLVKHLVDCSNLVVCRSSMKMMPSPVTKFDLATMTESQHWWRTALVLMC